MVRFSQLLILFLISLTLCGQQDTREFRVGFWNLENLFDTINNPLTADDDFTPEGGKNWTKSRFNKKIHNLSRTIIAMGEWNNLALLGVCEVENDTVIKKLLYHSPLKHLNYRYIHYDSDDPRGIDVALIYRPDVFTPLHSQPLRVGESLRDILYVKGTINTDTLHIFVNHWQSRRSGFYSSEKGRLKSATILRNSIDSLLLITDANILIMGDFNDNPNDKSLELTLGATHHDDGSKLVNLTYPQIYKSFGTLKFRGKWNVFDNIIVSSNLLNRNCGLRVVKGSCRVFYTDDIIKINNSGFRPNPTYLGPYYNGGTSDHLPVIVDFLR